MILLFKPGHGGSDGLHGYVHSLDYAVDDLVCFDLYLHGADGVYFASDESKCTLFFSNILQKSFLDKVLSENPGLPCFCFGHSTGAAIVLKVCWYAMIVSCISPNESLN